MAEVMETFKHDGLTFFSRYVNRNLLVLSDEECEVEWVFEVEDVKILYQYLDKWIKIQEAEKSKANRIAQGEICDNPLRGLESKAYERGVALT